MDEPIVWDDSNADPIRDILAALNPTEERFKAQLKQNYAMSKQLDDFTAKIKEKQA